MAGYQVLFWAPLIQTRGELPPCPSRLGSPVESPTWSYSGPVFRLSIYTPRFPHSLPIGELDGRLNETIRWEFELLWYVFTKVIEHYHSQVYVISKPGSVMLYEVMRHKKAHLSLLTMAVWMSCADSAEMFHWSWRAGFSDVVATGEDSANTS